MLKTLLKIAFIVLLALTFAEIGRRDPGYVLINYQGLIIETSLLVIGIAGILIVLLLSLLNFFTKPIWSRLFPLAKNTKLEKSHTKLTEGMLSLSDGDWITAEKHLKRIPNTTSLALIAILGKARAAYELGQEPKALAYLADAKQLDHKKGNKHRHHLLLAECQFAIASTDYGKALRALNQISANHQNAPFWKLKARILMHTQQWHQLYALLPKIRQDKLFSENELLDLEVACFTNLMHNQPLETQLEFWKTIPAKRRQLAPLAQVKFESLLEIGENDLAFELAKEQIQRGVESEWTSKIAKLTQIDWQTRYNLVTKYFGNQASNIQVSKSLGLIAHQGNNIDTALEHFNHILQLDPKDLACQLLVFKLEQQQDQAKSPEQQLSILTEKIETT